MSCVSLPETSSAANTPVSEELQKEEQMVLTKGCLVGVRGNTEGAAVGATGRSFTPIAVLG